MLTNRSKSIANLASSRALSTARDGSAFTTYVTTHCPLSSFLHCSTRKSNAIFLVSRSPGLDGTELLARLRADGSLKTLPVVVMTGEGDSFAASELPVEAFLTKPLAFDKFIEIVRQLSAFWQADMLAPVHVAELPVVEDDELMM